METIHITTNAHGFSVGDEIKIPSPVRYDEDGEMKTGVWAVTSVESNTSFDVRTATRFEVIRFATKRMFQSIKYVMLGLWDEMKTATDTDKN